MRLIDKNIKAIAKHISAKWNVRPTLAWVCIRNEFYYATDSYKAVKFPMLKKDSKHFPEIPWEVYTEEIKEDIIIRSADIEKLNFWKNKLMPIINNVAIANYSNWKLDLCSTDLDSSDIKKVKLINWVFPDVDKFLWEIQSWYMQNKVALDVDIMIDLLKCFKECWIERVIYEIRNPNDWVIVSWYDDKDYKAIVMPLKIN